MSAHVVRWLVVGDGGLLGTVIFLRASLVSCPARVLAWSSLPGCWGTLSWMVAATPTHPELVLRYARNLKDLAASTVWPRASAVIDFVYVPVDFKHRAGYGCALINFLIADRGVYFCSCFLQHARRACQDANVVILDSTRQHRALEMRRSIGISRSW